MTLTQVMKSLINTYYGWSVAEQFEDTFDGGQSFEEQNENALEYINIILKDILDNDSPFSNSAKQELFLYQKELQNYLKDKMALGGLFGDSRYNYGRSWTLDHKQHNKGESYETPMRNRKRKY